MVLSEMNSDSSDPFLPANSSFLGPSVRDENVKDKKDWQFWHHWVSLRRVLLAWNKKIHSMIDVWYLLAFIFLLQVPCKGSEINVFRSQRSFNPPIYSTLNTIYFVVFCVSHTFMPI